MLHLDDDPNRDELDDFVRAFEQAYSRDGHAEIAKFLPPRDHPLYATVLCELIRLDLEFGWEQGCPKTLSEYQRVFPELQRDRDALRAIAFEEDRVRRHAEESLSPNRSRRRDEGIPGKGIGRLPQEGAPGQHARGRLSDGLESMDPGDPSGGDDDGQSRRNGVERAALAYRDFRMHHDEGDIAALDSWCASFPGRVGHARLFRDVHLSDPHMADRLAHGLTTMPEVGDNFLGFHLIGELGRGAFSRVYLAQQGDLANRPVALKVSPECFSESQTLAQLQHANIVPIYSIHHVEALHAVCMPYFGSTTLKDVYRDLRKHEALPASGKGLLSTLYNRKSDALHRGSAISTEVEMAEGPAALSEREPVGATTPSPSRPQTTILMMLEKLTYVQAVLWMVARLADGLVHAHERGILHRDLKPANILLTDEGQPMLLDFNLSEDLKVRSGAAAAIGGTLPYMSPEHLDAFRGGAHPVDARSDLYSLGVILYELLAGRRPFEIPDAPTDRKLLDLLIEGRLGTIPDVRRWNQTVTPAVVSIIHHCLETDPQRRYQNARELSEDLERHLAHRPLKSAHEPSLRERMTKWARRHPTLCSSTSIALLALTLILLLGSVAWFVAEDLGNASARLRRGDFRAAFEKCQFLLNTNGGPPEHLERGIRLARHTLDGYGVGGPGDWTAGPWVRRLPAAEQRALCEEASELVLLEVRASITLAERSQSKPELTRSLQRGVLWLDRLERFDPRPPAALYEDRGRFYAALGRSDLADRDRARVSTVPPSSARDFYLLGTSLLARGQLALAELRLSRAVALDTRRFWAWFTLGICHSDQGRHADAAFDFSVSTTLAPNFAWPHLNRGLALARSGRLREARVAYDRALELNPDFTEALVDRALACLELGDWDQATRDLDRAIALGRRTPSIWAARADALARLGRRDEAEQAFAEAIQAADPNDPIPLVARGYSRLAADRAGAEADLARALHLDPHNARAHLGRAYLLRRDDPHAALVQVETALNAEPNFGDALQLRALLRARLGDPAAEADVNRLLQVPTPRHLYNAACALALLSRSAAEPRLVPLALDLLRRALDSGMPPACVADDPDLNALRESPDYSRLLRQPAGGSPPKN